MVASRIERIHVVANPKLGEHPVHVVLTHRAVQRAAKSVLGLVDGGREGVGAGEPHDSLLGARGGGELGALGCALASVAEDGVADLAEGVLEVGVVRLEGEEPLIIVRLLWVAIRFGKRIFVHEHRRIGGVDEPVNVRSHLDVQIQVHAAKLPQHRIAPKIGAGRAKVWVQCVERCRHVMG